MKRQVQLNKEDRRIEKHLPIAGLGRTASDISKTISVYIQISDMNLHMVGKLRCGITTLNARLTHGTETENKGQKLGVDHHKRGEGNKP